MQNFLQQKIGIKYILSFKNYRLTEYFNAKNNCKEFEIVGNGYIVNLKFLADKLIKYETDNYVH